jgi:hypothetical protein
MTTFELLCVRQMYSILVLCCLRGQVYSVCGAFLRGFCFSLHKKFSSQTHFIYMYYFIIFVCVKYIMSTSANKYGCQIVKYYSVYVCFKEFTCKLGHVQYVISCYSYIPCHNLSWIKLTWHKCFQPCYATFLYVIKWNIIFG